MIAVACHWGRGACCTAVTPFWGIAELGFKITVRHSDEIVAVSCKRYSSLADYDDGQIEIPTTADNDKSRVSSVAGPQGLA
jgi:hypothetical protein